MGRDWDRDWDRWRSSCVFLTPAEVIELQNQGYTVTGPFACHAECAANCGGCGSGSGEPEGSGQPEQGGSGEGGSGEGESGGSGTGEGSGSGVGLVASSCCPDGVPEVLYFNWSGCCDNLCQVPLLWNNPNNPGTPGWTSDPVACGEVSMVVNLVCVCNEEEVCAFYWGLTIVGGAQWVAGDITSWDCDPFLATGTFAGTPPYCDDVSAPFSFSANPMDC